MEHRIFRGQCTAVVPLTSVGLLKEQMMAGGSTKLPMLPADETELERLDVQHRAFKAMQGGKNYWAPIDEVLKAAGEVDEEKRLLDVGTGNGVWAIEIATEFPHVQVIGTDLSPVQYQHQAHVPDNCHFAHEDAAKGLSYPEDYFDVVHVRMLVAGIRDWSALVNEVVRVLKSRGLMIFTEPSDVVRLAEDTSINASRSIAPGLITFAELFNRALGIRGLHPHTGKDVIPVLLKANEQTRDVAQKPMSIPLASWSTDPLWHNAGQIMAADTRDAPEAVRLLISDACGLTTTAYDELKAGFLKDLFEHHAHGVLSLAHNWAFKV